MSNRCGRLAIAFKMNCVLRYFTVPFKSRKLAPHELKAFETKRNLGAEMLESIIELRAGGGQVVFSPDVPDPVAAIGKKQGDTRRR